ncbi:PREDICTED: DNA-directed RNA polymerases I and III subunit RPAC2-like [Amphimedon queenslandica]|uniref:DNA-directed RNA polymerases I and III subunit RPAC2 n=1 Tax=Amphimedon queenslandica TaxID=400682 RepID=A0A1X7VMQ2_AMPQE|nr:PREDICTED: DNA-directed RNA polymerases I and III subunit RPAC2-like [Amphimedon queenslandica]|eukprot:XP_003383582.1 PREDICTED: DNA-directed RNA polymerases I and III subunit RPAC2-like [Amphimedon queenslandica]
MEEDKLRLHILPLEDPDDVTCMTFVLQDEDHTLGNALRWILIKNPDVSFCGYSTPHPSERKINLRIQTTGISATEVLRRGLEDLRELFQHIHKTYEASVQQFKADET